MRLTSQPRSCLGPGQILGDVPDTALSHAARATCTFLATHEQDAYHLVASAGLILTDGLATADASIPGLGEAWANAVVAADGLSPEQLSEFTSWWFVASTSTFCPEFGIDAA